MVKDKKKALKRLNEILDDTKPEVDTSTPADIMGLSEIADTLTGRDKLDFITNLSSPQDNDFSILYALNSKLQSDLLQVYIEKRLALRTTLGGKRANDLITLSNNFGQAIALMVGAELKNEDRPGFMRRIREKV